MFGTDFVTLRELDDSEFFPVALTANEARFCLTAIYRTQQTKMQGKRTSKI